MAKSPAHKFGQIIGDVLEDAVEPLLQQFANDHDLFLDKKGPRPARKGSRKVSWKDSDGNIHDLDFVLERNGTLEKVGAPLAFIETAWRRYTRHSRNKAQEIQGAILPLAATHKDFSPFKGAILAGVFTEGALAQLRSLGFTVLYFPYETIIKSFYSVGIDASFDEGTSDEEFKHKVRRWEKLPPEQQSLIAKKLVELNLENVTQFLVALGTAISREIIFIRILPLHGHKEELGSVEQAIAFIRNYDVEETGPKPLIRYEVEIIYNNGDNIRAAFTNKETAIQFLRSYHRN